MDVSVSSVSLSKPFTPQFSYLLNGDNKVVSLLLLLGGLNKILHRRHKAWHANASKMLTGIIIIIINHPHHTILLAKLKADTKMNARDLCLQESCN